MPATSQNVRLLAATPNALELIYAAFRQCYHAGYVGTCGTGWCPGCPP
jgi:thymidylate synthase (FAD)